MKKYLLFASMILAATACGSKEQKDEAAATDSAQAHQHNTPEATHPDFSTVEFASKIDTTCGMPITAGVVDTAVVNGKVYGFCAKECKDEFVKTLSAKAK